MIRMDSEENIELPDLSFVKFCEERYGINRGVYNTIDKWFYERGIVRIVKRRRMMITFLAFVSRERSTRKVYFGPNGLAMRLQDFWKQEQIHVDILEEII